MKNGLYIINGDKLWYKNDSIHREDGPAIEYTNGYKVWALNGRRHREGGPAVIYANGDKYWYTHGKADRLDGPAVEPKLRECSWFINNKKIDELEYKNWLLENGMFLDNLSEDDKLLIRLKFG